MKAKEHVYDLNRVELWEKLPLHTPYHISIEATFRCNMRCNYCIHAMDAAEIRRRGYQLKDMPWETFERILDSIQEFDEPIKSVVFSGLGEPLVNKRLPEMIRLVKETGKVEKILLITNGLLLTPETTDALIEAGLDVCKVSLQGMGAKSYKEVCGVTIDWDEFYEQLVYFSKHKKNCLLKLKTGDICLAEEERESFYEKFGSICDYVDIEHIYPQFDGVDYSSNVFADAGKNRFWHDMEPLKVCSPLFYRLYVLQDGRVTFAYPDGITYPGFNVKERSLRNIWEAPETKAMWKDALEHKITACQKCPRWAYSAHPKDIVDGHETEILEKLGQADTVSENRVVLCLEE